MNLILSHTKSRSIALFAHFLALTIKSEKYELKKHNKKCTPKNTSQRHSKSDIVGVMKDIELYNRNKESSKYVTLRGSSKELSFVEL